MPKEILDRPKLVGSESDLNHALTDHASDSTPTMAAGGRRKSKFYAQENHVINQCILPAFLMFANAVGNSLNGGGPYPAGPNQGVMVPTNPINGRVVYDAPLGKSVGTNPDGDEATSVRIVMDVTPSGSATIVSAYPI